MTLDINPYLLALAIVCVTIIKAFDIDFEIAKNRLFDRLNGGVK